MARMPKSLRDDPELGPKLSKMPRGKTRALLKNPNDPRTRGRPRFDTETRCDLDKVEELAAQNATQEEIAVHLECCWNTVARYAKNPKSDFSRAYKRGQVRYAFWLKQHMRNNVENGNATIQIWLSKQAPINYKDQPMEVFADLSPRELQRAKNEVLGMPEDYDDEEGDGEGIA